MKMHGDISSGDTWGELLSPLTLLITLVSLNHVFVTGKVLLTCVDGGVYALEGNHVQMS